MEFHVQNNNTWYDGTESSTTYSMFITETADRRQATVFIHTSSFALGMAMLTGQLGIVFIFPMDSIFSQSQVSLLLLLTATVTPF